MLGKRGFFGWLFLVIFWMFNGLMALWIWSYCSDIGHAYSTASGPHLEAAKIGTAIGGTIGITILIGIWVAGAVILGLLALLTRGQKTIVIKQMTP